MEFINVYYFAIIETLLTKLINFINLKIYFIKKANIFTIANKCYILQTEIPFGSIILNWRLSFVFFVYRLDLFIFINKKQLYLTEHLIH